MVEIFVEQISERLIYTLDFVFIERGLTYKLNNDFLSFQNSSLPRLNYSNKDFNNILQLYPSSVLFDEVIREYEIGKGIFENEECLIFDEILDPLAAIFYILSRMEEYTNNREDEHERFSSKFSIQHTYKWLDKAICDRWSVALINSLTKKLNCNFEPEKIKVAICPTFDIDNTFAFQWKQGARKWLSIARDRINFDKKRIEQRRLILNKKIKDPFDTFDYIKSISVMDFNVNIFWLLGDYAKFDRNITHTDIRHQKLIQSMGELAIVGIHPSYKSNSHEFHVNEEILRLEAILNNKVTCSRQHFLKLKVRITYPILLHLGIKEDFSMGYADQVGFRCGTARPYYWFNLNNNRITDLIIHPFVYMDGTLNEYLKLNIDESKNVIWKLYCEVSRFGGDFSFIWHNETIGDYGKWKGWRDVLEYSLSLKERK